MTRYGYSMGESISIGLTLGKLVCFLENITNSIKDIGFQHNMLEAMDIIFGEKLTGGSKDDLEVNLKRIKQIEVNVNYFNQAIESLNKNLIGNLSFYYKNLPLLKPLNKEELLIQLNKRFQKRYQEEESKDLANEVLDLKIISIVNDSLNSILIFDNFFKKSVEDMNTERLSKKYVRGFIEAKIILSTGCSETAVFVAGRTIESLINDLINNEIRKSNLPEIDLKNMKLEHKIGKLKSISVIDEKEFHILQRLKFDRNDFGHPFDKEISFEEAKRIIWMP